jgi:hypothetical protein
VLLALQIKEDSAATSEESVAEVATTEAKIIPVVVPAMFISVTTPAQGVGISIEALSLSSVIMLSSALIVSPTDTKISITY